jgi:hypothetical protein
MPQRVSGARTPTQRRTLDARTPTQRRTLDARTARQGPFVEGSVLRPGRLGKAARRITQVRVDRALDAKGDIAQRRNCWRRGLGGLEARHVTVTVPSSVEDRRVGSVGQQLGSDGRPSSSDLKPHLNDRLGNRSQAGVVVAGVRVYELVGLIDRDSMALGGDPLGLFDDDP